MSFNMGPAHVELHNTASNSHQMLVMLTAIDAPVAATAFDSAADAAAESTPPAVAPGVAQETIETVLNNYRGMKRKRDAPESKQLGATPKKKAKNDKSKKSSVSKPHVSPEELQCLYDLKNHVLGTGMFKGTIEFNGVHNKYHYWILDVAQLMLTFRPFRRPVE